MPYDRCSLRPGNPRTWFIFVLLIISIYVGHCSQHLVIRWVIFSLAVHCFRDYTKSTCFHRIVHFVKEGSVVKLSVVKYPPTRLEKELKRETASAAAQRFRNLLPNE